MMYTAQEHVNVGFTGPAMMSGPVIPTDNNVPACLVI